MNRDLQRQFQLLAGIRQFFVQRDFVDVLTPPMVGCPAIEPYIQPFRVNEQYYLHTSPEFWMKYLLSEGMERIFSIAYCFRDGPISPIHRPQFLMLEWYRADSGHHQIIEDLEQLGKHLLSSFGRHEESEQVDITVMTVQQLFERYLGMDILQFGPAGELRRYIERHHPDVPLPKCELPWDDYFHLLMLNKLTPELRRYRFLVLKEYPAQLRALSRLKRSDPRVCERFEFFIDGMEVANCYGELTDLEEQQECFQAFNRVRKGTPMPAPKVLFHALKRAFPPARELL